MSTAQNSPSDLTPAARPHRRRRWASVGVAAVAGLALAGAGLASGTSADSARAADAGVGWVRLAHLSPDTKAVDVRVTPLGSDDPAIALTGVAYGTVSDYAQLAAGVYRVVMVPTGAPASTKPVVSASLDVAADKAETVAAFGANKKLKVSSFDDDLAAPAAGTARIRLIQASTEVSSVSVATTTGMPIVDSAKAGSATGYAAVPAGPWTLELTGKGVKDTADVTLQDGSVTTLFVLDTASGLTVRPVLDSSAVGRVPTGGVNTGGGWLATHGGAVEIPGLVGNG